MTSSPSNKAIRGAGLLALAVVIAPALTGCDELSARRTIQKGDKLYKEAKFDQAIVEYEKALEMSPGLSTGHHNLALAYFREFENNGDNTSLAEKSATHFLAYLEQNPNDDEVIRLLTRIWLDSDQFEKALAFWEDQRAKNPSDPVVLARLADINRQAGRFDKALEWLNKRVEVEQDQAGKVRGFIDIAQLQWSRLTKSELVDEERVEVADSGIAALQKAFELNSDNAQIQSLMGSLYQFRALAHGASWARTVDAAAQRYHQIKAVKMTRASEEPADKTPADKDKGGAKDGAKDEPGPKKDEAN